ncbi:CocE/NonD family hydrolase [Nocardia brasiliensis]|uniref:CocE/NonD family hydrolase n=1 Tax=Nocardia brasiliensis TaxID=37326 RepID=UPI0018959211|nr:CocE/NonD family hydrolase [Nocardia brasiliensis]MBF6129381.1 acetylxylan esterase [Nocardia brasiliensis]
MSMRLTSALAAALLAAAALTVGDAPATAVPIPGGQATTLFIPGSGGVRLNAVITAPADFGARKHPLVIQPSGWGMPAVGSLGSAYKLSSGADFVSIEYTARGMYLSEGEVDVLGPNDAADVTAIIDWAIANVNVDPERIAIAGGSYGAGMAIIGAAHDPRIKALVADSPPGDPAEALAPNGTPKTGGPVALALSGAATNRYSPDLTARGLDTILRGKGGAFDSLPSAQLLAEAVPALNANGTAVFLAHDWQDSLLPVDPVYAQFDRLTGPRKLFLQPGDHSTGGGAGQIVGLPNPIWDAALRWLDHYTNGAANGIENEPAVTIEPAGTGPYVYFDSVADAARTVRTLPLSAPAVGVIGADPGERWSQPTVSAPTIAVSAVPYVTGTLAQLGAAPPIPIEGIDRTRAGVWRSAPFEGGGVVSGHPRLDLTVIPPSTELTLVGILYDEAPDGTGKAISYWPLTRRGLTPGEPAAMAWDLAPTYWNIAPGHRLSLAVTSQDPIPFQSSTPLGSTVVFAAPSTVQLPVGDA